MSDARKAIKIFEERQVRAVWDEEREKWWFSVADVVAVLTDSEDYQQSRKYWKNLKLRLKKEGSEVVTNCYQLKLAAEDGKQRLTDVADTEQILRLVQSIPRPRVSLCLQIVDRMTRRVPLKDIRNILRCFHLNGKTNGIYGGTKMGGEKGM